MTLMYFTFLQSYGGREPADLDDLFDGLRAQFAIGRLKSIAAAKRRDDDG